MLAFTTKQGCFQHILNKKKKNLVCTEELQLACDIRYQPNKKLPVADWYWLNWDVICLWCKSVFYLKGVKVIEHSKETGMSQTRVAV